MLMLGLMMSRKTLRGIPSRWTDIFPKKKTIASIFVDHPAAYNCVHYADYDDETTLTDLLEAREWGGLHLRALQLDMIWPDPAMLKEFRRIHPEIELVLQVGGKALDAEENDSKKVSARIAGYDRVIDYVLLDKSMGKGKGLDAKFLAPFVERIERDLPDLGIAVAGGLGPDSVELLRPLLADRPYLSFDAQSKLRPSGNAEDPLELLFAWWYVQDAIMLIDEMRKSPCAP